LFLSKLSTISGRGSDQEVKEDKLQPMLARESTTISFSVNMGKMLFICLKRSISLCHLFLSLQVTIVIEFLKARTTRAESVSI
jgi:hypothetical protein